MIEIISLVKNGLFCIENYSSQFDYFTEVSDILCNENYVTDTFKEEIMKREAEFPTGILTKTIGICLPHVDSKYVLKNALIIHVFHSPLPFRRMDNTEEFIAVSIAFMLLIKDVQDHINAIQQLATIFQDSKFLEDLSKCSTKAEVIVLLEVYYGKNKEIA